jgi:hypothetical protein
MYCSPNPLVIWHSITGIVGRPILAAAAFSGGFRECAGEPAGKPAAARIGRPTEQRSRNQVAEGWLTPAARKRFWV